jgi:cation:H+ antiporter
MLQTIVLPLIGGLVVLTLGADRLVNAATRLALLMGIPPLIVGLTIVAMGTSAPEVAISVTAAVKGQGDIALGNVVGSNIMNLLIILGLAALLRPIRVQRQLLRSDLPIMIALTAMAWFFAWTDNAFTHTEGLVLIICLVPYLLFLLKTARKQKKIALSDIPILEEGARKPKATGIEILKDLVYFSLGLAALIFGAQYFTEGAVNLARFLDVPEWIIGLTIVSLGTSLPELATSVVAALKGSSDMAIGNIIGSNIFNILWVLGPAAILSPVALVVAPEALQLDFPFLMIVSLAALPVFLTGSIISRSEGLLFLLAYGYYLVTLIAQVQGSALYPQMLQLMLPVFAPIYFIFIFFLRKK